MHLHDGQPQTTKFFLDWLSAKASQADYLLFLGDVFDAWVGDDVTDQAPKASVPTWKMLADALAALRQERPLRLGLMVGNRDFLMGEGLAEQLGATCLSDYLVLSHPGLSAGPALLCHGDTLCTDDAAYQNWRRQARSLVWQREFLARPLAERLNFAQGLRMQSEHEKETKPAAWMDVVAEVADRMLIDYRAGVMVHGHTHLPGCYDLPSGRQRWVLPDWAFSDTGGRGGGLAIDRSGIHVVPVR